MPPEMQEHLSDSAKKMGWNKSELIRNLISKHLDLIVNDGEEIPVILRIPSSLREDSDELRKWLYAKSDAITKVLGDK